MSITIGLIGILITVILLFNVVCNYAKHRLDTMEDKLKDIESNINDNQYQLELILEYLKCNAKYDNSTEKIKIIMIGILE